MFLKIHLNFPHNSLLLKLRSNSWQLKSFVLQMHEIPTISTTWFLSLFCLKLTLFQRRIEFHQQTKKNYCIKKYFLYQQSHYGLKETGFFCYCSDRCRIITELSHIKGSAADLIFFSVCLLVYGIRDHPFKTSACSRGEGSKICQICRRIVLKNCRR